MEQNDTIPEDTSVALLVSCRRKSDKMEGDVSYGIPARISRSHVLQEKLGTLLG